MNGNKLLWNIHFMQDNRGNLVFKKEGAVFRINRLVNALGFVGCMKQLLMAIELAAPQDCFYRLCNERECEWHLCCCATDTDVSIALKTLPGWEEVFEWSGSIAEFKHAITGMLSTMSAYLFFR